MIYSMQNPTVR